MPKILVVDDNEENRELMATILRHQGYALLEAEDGAQALECVRAERPDLVISDILMPVMDGYEFVRRLRADAAVAATKTIFCTAYYHEREARRLAQVCGVLRILTKPYEPQALMAMAAEVLGQPAANEAPPQLADFDSEHRRLMTDKLARQAAELQQQVAHLEVEIAERKRAEGQIRDYARRLVEIQEQERRDLSRELHDRVGANLSALMLNLHLIRGLSEASGRVQREARIVDCESLLRDTIQHVRDVTADLRPAGLDELGFLVVFGACARQVAARAGIRIEVRGTEPSPRLTPTAEIALFRIGQEALNNVIKHAGAQNVTVELEACPEIVTFIIADDGRSFDPGAGATMGQGMTTMRERADAIGARLTVSAQPGMGTAIRVEAPRRPEGLESVRRVEEQRKS